MIKLTNGRILSSMIALTVVLVVALNWWEGNRKGEDGENLADGNSPSKLSARQIGGAVHSKTIQRSQNERLITVPDNAGSLLKGKKLLEEFKEMEVERANLLQTNQIGAEEYLSISVEPATPEQIEYFRKNIQMLEGEITDSNGELVSLKSFYSHALLIDHLHKKCEFVIRFNPDNDALSGSVYTDGIQKVYSGLSFAEQVSNDPNWRFSHLLTVESVPEAE